MCSLLCVSLFAAANNDVQPENFTPPALVSLSDPSITVGTPVWNSTDGKYYVVHSKPAPNAVLIDLASPGFVTTPTVPLSTKVIIVPRVVVTIPPQTESNP